MRDINEILALSEAEWKGVAEVAHEWEEWDYGGRLSYLADRGVEEDRLLTLRRLASDGAMTAAQLERFSRLEALVAQGRPVLDGLPLGGIPGEETT